MNIPAAPKYELSIKDALVFAGLLDKSKAGRGKPSRLMQEQADMLVTEHAYRIKGRTVDKSSTSTAPTVQRVKAAVGKVISDIPDQMRGIDLIPYVEGKPWKMGIAGCCNLCGNSLTYCPHPEPVVWVDFDRESVVTFRPGKGVKTSR